MGKKAWWSKGVQFECQGSGKCCVSRGEYGYVYLTLKDRKRLAQHLAIPTRKFTQTHCTSKDGWIFIKDPQLPCRFLKDNQCSVYEARPTQCRTWPFWPENMNPRVWKKEIASYCPGVGKGRTFPADEIQEILNESKSDSSKKLP